MSHWNEMKWSESCSVVSNSLQPLGLYSPWNSPGQNIGVSSCSLLQEIFPTQGLNPGFHLAGIMLNLFPILCTSVQFSHSVVSDSLWPHELQHAKPLCPSPTPKLMATDSDAIQPSHPLSSPSPPALNLSQHQGLCKWASPSHQVAKVLEFQLQHQSFHWTPRTDLL